MTHKPTDETRASVEALASFGVGQEDIAKHIGISHATLRKYYREELDLSAINANRKVLTYLFSLASGMAIKESGATHGDCKAAAIFWAKTRCGWRETAQLDHTSSDGSMTPKASLDLSQLPDEVLQAIVDAAEQQRGE